VAGWRLVRNRSCTGFRCTQLFKWLWTDAYFGLQDNNHLGGTAGDDVQSIANRNAMSHDNRSPGGYFFLAHSVAASSSPIARTIVQPIINHSPPESSPICCTLNGALIG